jgi:hypothetical protein
MQKNYFKNLGEEKFHEGEIFRSRLLERQGKYNEALDLISEVIDNFIKNNDKVLLAKVLFTKLYILWRLDDVDLCNLLINQTEKLFNNMELDKKSESFG